MWRVGGFAFVACAEKYKYVVAFVSAAKVKVFAVERFVFVLMGVFLRVYVSWRMDLFLDSINMIGRFLIEKINSQNSVFGFFIVLVKRS